MPMPDLLTIWIDLIVVLLGCSHRWMHDIHALVGEEGLVPGVAFLPLVTDPRQALIQVPPVSWVRFRPAHYLRMLPAVVRLWLFVPPTEITVPLPVNVSASSLQQVCDRYKTKSKMWVRMRMSVCSYKLVQTLG